MSSRPVPGFQPSPSAITHAQEVMVRVVGLLNAAGLESQDDVDCFVAMVAGVMAAQIANDPGADHRGAHRRRGAPLAQGPQERTKRPRPIVALPLLELPAPVGRQKIRSLFDMGFTRDVWMHRRQNVAESIGR